MILFPLTVKDATHFRELSILVYLDLGLIIIAMESEIFQKEKKTKKFKRTNIYLESHYKEIPKYRMLKMVNREQ